MKWFHVRAQGPSASHHGPLPLTPALCLLCLAPLLGHGASWTQRHRDAENTGRADFVVPDNRQGASFFSAIRWQKRAPGSPGEGRLTTSSMVFFDGSGPGGTDLVVSGYHWPKGVQGMDRHTGKLLWLGNPEGGESIGAFTPAFSPNGATIYVINDATTHPLMAFASAIGPSIYWHNGSDPYPNRLSVFSPKVAPDGRVFGHQWNDRPYGAIDSGSAVTSTWSAAAGVCDCISLPAIWTSASRTNVLATGRCGELMAFDGGTGALMWKVSLGMNTDADPTVDPTDGRVYLPIGENSIKIAGVDQDGAPLWAEPVMPVYSWEAGVNHPQRVQSPGCLAHDGQTYYFQSVSEQGEGRLYAINTGDGSLKWSFATGSSGWDGDWAGARAAPIVSMNGIIIVGNNEAGAYLAIRDDGGKGTLLATLPVASGGKAYGTPTLSPDGLLYLPARLLWTQANGDGDVPTQREENLFNAFDLTASPQITLPPPGSQRARPLNAAIELRWLPVTDAAWAFSRYAIYRATSPFTNVSGMTPVATVSNREAATYLDAPLINGSTYYYFITTISANGAETKTAKSIGGFRPFSETDLQVVSISRTPRFPRYAPNYEVFEITEPSGYGPYMFSAATSLREGQTTSTQRWPETNAPVTYTATVRNRGSNPWTNSIACTWQWDGTNVQSVVLPGALGPDGMRTTTLVRPWDGSLHDVRFSIVNADARTSNNSLAISTKSVAFLSYIDETYYESFRFQTTNFASAVTDDLIDWIQRHMARFNQLFSNAGCDQRVHYDVLEVVADNSPTPLFDEFHFAIFPLRFNASEAPSSFRNSGWYGVYANDDIDYGYLHEMGHQLGLIDLYQFDLDRAMNRVSGLGYSAPADLMHSCNPVLSRHSALGMTRWLDEAHGYYGQYLYGIPEQVRMRFVTRWGEPLSGATVKAYQLEERPGLGKLISTQIRAQGLTDSNGVWTIPNVPIDPSKVPPLPNGDVLRDNPFGYLAVIGANGALHFQVEHQGAVDFAWLDITEANVAYYEGQTHQVTFERRLALGGPIQRFPPADLTETNDAGWVALVDGGNINAAVIHDASNKQVGSESMGVVVDAGEAGPRNLRIRYPGDLNAQWDLTHTARLNIRFYGADGFNPGDPLIRLRDGSGNYVQFQFYRDGQPGKLVDEPSVWRSFSIPLDASDTTDNGWRRTMSGTPDLARINALEMSAAYWSWGEGWSGCRIDGVSFEPPSGPELSATPVPGGVMLSWLETSPVPVVEAGDQASGPFLPIVFTPSHAGGVTTVVVPAADAQRFFRLRLP